MAFTIEKLSYVLYNKFLIKEISLCLSPSQLYGVIGPNGSGKSTFLKNLARIWEPSSGKLFWNQQNLLNLSRFEMSRLISLVPQNSQIYFDFTVAEMIAMGCYPLHTLASQILKRRIRDSLLKVDALHLYERSFSTLSGGEKQRIYIARSLATEAPVLLLDEPTSNLDPYHKIETWKHLKNCSEQGKLVIVATHDLQMAKHFCNRLIVLHEGLCKAQGHGLEALTSQLLREVFNLDTNHEALI